MVHVVAILLGLRRGRRRPDHVLLVNIERLACPLVVVVEPRPRLLGLGGVLRRAGTGLPPRLELHAHLRRHCVVGHVFRAAVAGRTAAARFLCVRDGERGRRHLRRHGSALRPLLIEVLEVRAHLIHSADGCQCHPALMDDPDRVAAVGVGDDGGAEHMPPPQLFAYDAVFVVVLVRVQLVHESQPPGLLLQLYSVQLALVPVGAIGRPQRILQDIHITHELGGVVHAVQVHVTLLDDRVVAVLLLHGRLLPPGAVRRHLGGGRCPSGGGGPRITGAGIRSC
mmetsp:Transcript_1034/g.2679  ORF Transcript_1034/g.2679 Transcript_1034/m.2679 type:complete len:282 (+) Transcript_1034:1124-1969(+)